MDVIEKPSSPPPMVKQIIEKIGIGKITAFFALMIAVVVFNLHITTGLSVDEKKFVDWVESLHTARQESSNGPYIVTVKVTTLDGISWEVGGTASANSQAIRSLELLREAPHATVAEKSPGEDLSLRPDYIQIVASDGFKKFVLEISQSDITHSIQAQNFLKLSKVLAAARG